MDLHVLRDDTKIGKRRHLSFSAYDPDVWSGRAEQEDFDKLVVSGLA
jgi:hypothetical protein